MDKYSECRSRTPIYRAFILQRKTAKDKGIDWSLSFEAWCQVWRESGLLGERSGGQWRMARQDESRPFEYGNVQIGPRYGRERPKRPRLPGDPGHATLDHDPIATDDSKAWRVKCVEGNARFVAAMRRHHPEREGVSGRPGTEMPRSLSRSATIVVTGENWNWP